MSTTSMVFGVQDSPFLPLIFPSKRNHDSFKLASTLYLVTVRICIFKLKMVSVKSFYLAAIGLHFLSGVHALCIHPNSLNQMSISKTNLPSSDSSLLRPGWIVQLWQAQNCPGQPNDSLNGVGNLGCTDLGADYGSVSFLGSAEAKRLCVYYADNCVDGVELPINSGCFTPNVPIVSLAVVDAGTHC